MSGELERVGRSLRSARSAQQAAFESARVAAVAAMAAGVSESQVARTVGVDRMTVRKWAGKR